ncbi:hypothetical protein ACFX13_044894 [Malus domestica]
MDLKNTSPFFFFALLISVTKALDPSCASQSDGSDDLSIIPTYSKCSPFSSPKTDSLVTTVLNMASKDPTRVNYLSTPVPQKTTSASIASGQQVLNIANYVVQLKLGTPSQLMNIVLDTSNDIAWAPCSGCTGCSSTTFSPNSSSTYGSLECSVSECAQARGLSCPATGSTATLVQDVLRLGKDVIPKYSFGCINSISGGSIPSQGLLGLGRGSMSLKLGPPGQPKLIRTTPLLRNPRRRSLYYVNLTGISVGRVLVPISPELLAFNPNTEAGTIINLGTVITRFVPPVYTALRDEFRKQVKGTFSSLGAFDTCFSATNEVVAPTITLQFTGLKLTLSSENSLIHSSSGSLACLAMTVAPNNVNSVLNVIANLQQQNLRILFDVANSVVGIARESCN